MSASGTSGASRRRVVAWLQPLFGLTILAVVAWFLPWRDTLVVPDPDGATRTAVTGRIVGDWQSDAVTFDAGPSLESELPAPVDPVTTQVVLERADSGNWLAPGFAPELELRPGLPRIFTSVEPIGLARAMGFFFLALLCGVTRWWRLLRLAEVGARWRDAFRLTFLGLFFNLVVPGLTGGDVVKAVLAVKENPGSRADALISVIVDRIFGLFTLVLLAAVVVFALGDTFAELRVPVLVLAVAMSLGILVYCHHGLRHAIGFDRRLAKLPFGDKLKRLDDAVLLYSRHPIEVLLAIAFSLGNHFCAILGVLSLGIAFGVSSEAIGFWDWVAIVPVANIVSSLPIAPGGWGVGEAAYAFLFRMIGVSAALGVAVSIGFRLCQLLLGALGGLYLLVPGQREELAEVEEELHPSHSA